MVPKYCNGGCRGRATSCQCKQGPHRKKTGSERTHGCSQTARAATTGRVKEEHNMQLSGSSEGGATRSQRCVERTCSRSAGSTETPFPSDGCCTNPSRSSPVIFSPCRGGRDPPESCVASCTPRTASWQRWPVCCQLPLQRLPWTTALAAAPKSSRTASPFTPKTRLLRRPTTSACRSCERATSN